VVDDAASVRRSLRLRLSLEHDLEIAGEAAITSRALELAELLQPHVVLIDVVLEAEDDGLELSERLRARVPGAAVIVLTHHDDVATRVKAAAAGAVAVVSKRAPIDALIAEIRRAGRTCCV
jgi:DNA-binding NarL/FixJ family response regulator